jgi:hypothetical protein
VRDDAVVCSSRVGRSASGDRLISRGLLRCGGR